MDEQERRDYAERLKWAPWRDRQEGNGRPEGLKAGACADGEVAPKAVLPSSAAPRGAGVSLSGVTLTAVGPLTA